MADNGSRTPEGEEIKKRYPEIKVIQNTNTGFAGGNNAGLKVAQGEYLFFLNNDTLIQKPMLEALVRRLEADKMNGGVSPMLKYSYAPDTLQYAGFTPFSPITLRNASIGFNEKDQPQYRMARETASLHGAAMMVPPSCAAANRPHDGSLLPVLRRIRLVGPHAPRRIQTVV